MTIGFKIGTFGQDAVTGICTLGATLGANVYQTLGFPFGTGYAVTAGKTLYITEVFFHNDAGARQIYFGYGDTDVDDSVAAPTNAVQIGGNLAILTANVVYKHDVFIPVPATKYPFFWATGSNAYVTALGVEV